MAVQQRRTSKHRRDKRRAHDALVTPTTTACRKCGALKKPHRVCACGMYNDLRVTKGR